MGINLVLKRPININHSNPTLIFVHGAWHGAWCWEENFLPFFVEHGYTCYAFDLPGHGQEKDQKGINKLRIKDYVVRLQSVIEAVEGPVVLIGHSMGGYIVQKYIEQADCAGAVLLTAVPGVPIWNMIFKLFKKQPLSMLKLLTTFDLTQIINTPEKVGQQFFSTNLPQDKLERYAGLLGSESYSVMVFDFLLSKIKQRKNLHFPVLVQCAGKDQMVTVQDNKATARLQKADFQFFKDLAHDVMLDLNWENSANGILSWLEHKFPEVTKAKGTSVKNPNLKKDFPDAVNDIITNLGKNLIIDANKTKILGLGKSKRNN